MPKTTKSLGIVGSDNREDQERVREMLTKAYWMEIETVMSYMAASIIQGVIEAEAGAVEFYTEIVEATEDIDPATQDMVIAILRDEQQHMRRFEGFAREYTEHAHE